ncbi:DUF6923 family protein [Clostridium sp. B9]|uniref:DUF6923 family protein n=1 Tax=Clostridium sp. B9 TaxID=3423224 RepID=UPI003D2ED6ED
MAFQCNSFAYQFAGSPTEVFLIDLITGISTKIGDLGGIDVNAIGFNPVDNLIYGYDQSNREIVSVDENLNVTTLTPRPTGLPNIQGFTTGTIDPNGYYYMYGATLNRFFVVDLDSSRSTYGKLVDSTMGYIEQTGPNYGVPFSPSGSITIHDWAWNTDNNTLFAIIIGGTGVSINPLTGSRTTLSTSGLPGGIYGAIFSYADGQVFAIRNTSGVVYRMNFNSTFTSVNADIFSQSASADTNDGANCIDAILLADFGDAPDVSSGNGPNDYSTLLANNGPRHGIINNLKFGTDVTSESDAYESPDARGDDLSQGVQDDAFKYYPTYEVGQPILSLEVTYTNDTGENANIYGWIDFNQNGIFELEEASTVVQVQSSTNNPRKAILNFNVPASSTLIVDDKTFSRFRITTDTLINTNVQPGDEDTRSLGGASDGEVEDFILLATLPQFECNTKGYQFYGIPTSVLEIDLITGEATIVASNISAGTINAIGYNPKDNLIYGIRTGAGGANDGLVRVDSNFNVYKLPTPVGLPTGTFYNTGAIDDNSYYYIYNGLSTRFYVIDVDSTRSTYGQLVDSTQVNPITGDFLPDTSPYGVPFVPTGSILTADWTYNPIDGKLYTVETNTGVVWSVDPETGIRTSLTTTGLPPQGYGGMFSYANGYIFAINNNTGQIYRIDLNDTFTEATGILFSQSVPNGFNDGTASCLASAFLIDFGDAPDISSGNSQGDYSTLLENNGPRHGIIDELRLGIEETSEGDAYQNTQADGDDQNQGIQDDGVIIPIEFEEGSTNYKISVSYTNETGEDAYIYAWIDFNKDGIFQLEEGISPVVVSSDIINPRTIDLNFNVPSSSTLVSGDISYLRIRITRDVLINNNTQPNQEDTRSIGPASDGEVEDYILNVIRNNLDFGDAPDTGIGSGPNNYSTLAISNGPTHSAIEGLRLGVEVTIELDAYENSTATGDDISQGIQDDGVITPIEFLEGEKIYSLDVSYTNSTGGDANLYAWIDFNRDGIFQLEEGITPLIVTSDSVNPRSINIQFRVPITVSLKAGETTFLRIRLTTENLLNTNTLPTEEDTRSLGPAIDGEVEDYLVTVTSRPSFLCEHTAYQVIAETNPNTGIPFNSQFRSIDPVTGKVTAINSNMGAIMNAIAYNPIDNYIYGIYDVNDPNAGNLARISADGVVTNLGPIPNLPNLNITNGAIDNNGFFYLKNQADDEYFVVDLRSGSANFGQLVDPTAGYVLATPPYSTTIAPGIGSTSGDWVFNPVDNLLYTFASGQFYTIVPTSGVSSPIPTEAGFPGGYGGMFNDANGFIYGISNPTGNIIRWQNVGGTMDGDFFSVSGPAQRQDATMCIRASILIDFGDAPDTSLGTSTNNYNTLLVSNGPRHGIVNNLTLGRQITSENDALQNSAATGDDILAGIQDDGPLGILEPIIGGYSTYTLPISYVNDTGKTAIIYAWVDFNRDGIFQLEEGTSVAVVSDTTNPRVENLIFNIPSGTTFNSGDLTFIRTRITTDNLVNSNILATQEDIRSLGPASDGEVEDYQVEIIVLNIEGTVWYDLNCNGIRDVGETLAERITVELYDVNNSNLPLEVTTTDSNGFYSFNNLPSGEYYVKVILPSGYEYTLSNVGNNDSIDSDVDEALGESPVFELSAQNQLEIVDAGLCRLNKITGQAFFDCNENGIVDSSEKFLCGVKITLLNEDGVEIGTVSTDCDGRYEFADLYPGTYTVIVTNQNKMTYTSQVLGAFYGSKPDNITGEFQVTLTSEDYLQGFAGFIGGLGLKMKFCIDCLFFCNTCSKKLETVNKSCICSEDENRCTVCNKQCIGCKKKISNRIYRRNID